MAEMINSSLPKGKHRRLNRSSAGIDLTAMVDLGFLLISFFMLSTTMEKQNLLEAQTEAKDLQRTMDQNPWDKMHLFLDDDQTVYVQLSNSQTKGNKEFSDYPLSSLQLKAVVHQFANHFKEKSETKAKVFIHSVKHSKLKDLVFLMELVKAETSQFVIQKPKAEAHQKFLEKLE